MTIVHYFLSHYEFLALLSSEVVQNASGTLIHKNSVCLYDIHKMMTVVHPNLSFLFQDGRLEVEEEYEEELELEYGEEELEEEELLELHQEPSEKEASPPHLYQVPVPLTSVLYAGWRFIHQKIRGSP